MPSCRHLLSAAFAGLVKLAEPFELARRLGECGCWCSDCRNLLEERPDLLLVRSIVSMTGCEGHVCANAWCERAA